MEPETQIITKMVIPLVILVLNVVLTALVGLVMFFMRDFRGSIREKFSEQDKKIDGVKDDLSEFKARLPQQYVLRDDFIRTITAFDTKLDRMGENVNKKIDQYINEVRRDKGEDK